MATCAPSAPSCAPSSGNQPAASAATRRGALALAGASLFAIATPVVALAAPASSPFRVAMAANAAAEARFVGLPDDLEVADKAAYEVEERRRLAVWDATLAAEPSTWLEFAEKFAWVSDKGTWGVDADASLVLYRDAQRLGLRA